MRIPGTSLFLAVISSQRPMNVGPTERAFGEKATWYVGKGQHRWYRAEGAENIVESGGLCESRNQAIEDAFKLNLNCLQLSDDLKGIKFANPDGSMMNLSGQEAALLIERGMHRTGAKLGGASPTANPFFCKRLESDRAFVVGDFMVIAPNPLRFDTNMKLKEDYDYTLQHIKNYERIYRCDQVMPIFEHRKNPGGAVAYRTDDRERDAIAYLKSKWGDLIGTSPRGDTEIRLKIRNSSHGKVLP